MLRKPSITPESKLYNLLVENFIDNQNDNDYKDDESFYIIKLPSSLIPTASKFNMIEIEDGLAYRPAQIFSESDLTKLEAFRETIKTGRTELKQLKSQLNLSDDESLIEAHRIYMDRLHRYNEAKDVAQALLGKLAHLKGKTTKDLYPEFDLQLED